MAATRLIALHVNKGKTVAQCLADRTDYSQNAAKTNDSEFISSYECDPKTADEEFLLSKRQYQHITGRQQKNNIIAYQIRQSFKPGEITPEEANQVGYETAMRWTKGKHAFIVATHIDKSHITYKLKLNGGDMKSVQGDSGHAQVKMVADVYSHIIDDDRRLNAERMEAAFYSGRQATPEPVQPAATESSADDKELLLKLLQNPEMAALLKSLAKTL